MRGDGGSAGRHDDRGMIATYLSWFDASAGPDPQPWNLDGDHPDPVPNAVYFARTFRELESALIERDPAVAAPLARVRVVLTPNPHRLPTTGPDVVGLLVWDNWSRVPRWADDVGLVLATNRGRCFTDALRMLPRPLGWAELLDEARVRVERERWARAARSHGLRRPVGAGIVPMPLGYAHQREVPEVAWEDRDIDVFFAGSAVHGLHRGGALRRRLRSSVGNVKTLHRQRMLAAADALRRELPQFRVEVELVDGDSVTDHVQTYSERMARSRFCLDPRGTSRETYRFYEAARVGTVPVTTSLPSGPLYDLAPSLRLRHWSELVPALRGMSRRPEEAAALHRRTRQWWDEQGGEAATARRLLPAFEALLRRLAAR